MFSENSLSAIYIFLFWHPTYVIIVIICIFIKKILNYIFHYDPLYLQLLVQKRQQ